MNDEPPADGDEAAAADAAIGVDNGVDDGVGPVVPPTAHISMDDDDDAMNDGDDEMTSWTGAGPAIERRFSSLVSSLWRSGDNKPIHDETAGDNVSGGIPVNGGNDGDDADDSNHDGVGSITNAAACLSSGNTHGPADHLRRVCDQYCNPSLASK